LPFATFIALTGILLVRPEDYFPVLQGSSLYLLCFVVCLLVNLPVLLEYVSPQQLRESPISLCVLGFFAASCLSLLVRREIVATFECIGDFGKDILYYLFLVCVVTTKQRLIVFLRFFLLFVLIQTSLALLNHEGIVVFETIDLKPHTERNHETGEEITYLRLAAAGIYNDPNDLCLAITCGAIICLFGLTHSPSILKPVWLLPLPLFCYAMAETRSRGGLLGLLAAVLGFLFARFGAKRMLPIACVVVPVMLAAFGGGRQTDINLNANDTSNERMQLWSEGFMAMSRGYISPIFGIGAHHYIDEVNMVAHNSFVESYVETGLLGGSLFTAAFVLSVWGVYRAGRAAPAEDDRELRLLYPCILALIVGYAGGCYSLSRNYIAPTYLTLGLAAAYIRIALPRDDSWWSAQLFGKRVLVIGLAAFAVLRVSTVLLVQW
jgi:putative inorganic carbon (hco3(-)) transporter